MAGEGVKEEVYQEFGTKLCFDKRTMPSTIPQICLATLRFRNEVNWNYGRASNALS
jgi:hypothetical protein